MKTRSKKIVIPGSLEVSPRGKKEVSKQSKSPPEGKSRPIRKKGLKSKTFMRANGAQDTPVDGCAWGSDQSESSPYARDRGLGSAVLRFTPKVLDDEGNVIKPEGWDKDVRYLASWEQDFTDEDMDTNKHNDEVEKIQDIAWMVTGFNFVDLAVFEDQVLELMNINWHTCWVPLHMVNLTPKGAQQPLLEIVKLKEEYHQLTLQQRKSLNKSIPNFVTKLLCRQRLLEESKFEVQSAFKYAKTDLSELGLNSQEEVVKCNFKATFEHCSMLFKSKDLWKALYERRLERVNKLLKGNQSPTLKQFKERVEAHLKLLAP